MTNTLLPIPKWQIFDQDGNPLAGGSVQFWQVDTTVPKDTWQDPLGQTFNTNPLILDSAGRAIVFGHGRYRCVIKDALGNLIYDQITGAALGDDVISDVMLPVVGAATLAEARRLLGVDDAIQNAIANIQLLPGPVGPQGPQGEIGPTGPQGPQGAAGAAGADGSVQNGTAGEAYTEKQSETQVTINSPSGIVQWGFGGSPGQFDTGGDAPASYFGSVETTRDGNTIYLSPVFNPFTGTWTNTGFPKEIIWDRPGPGTHTYKIRYFVDPVTAYTIGATTGGIVAWSDFQDKAWCHLTAQSM